MLVVILTLLCGSVNSPFLTNLVGKVNIPSAKEVNTSGAVSSLILPCSVLLQFFKSLLPSHQMHLCHSNAWCGCAAAAACLSSRSSRLPFSYN